MITPLKGPATSGLKPISTLRARPPSAISKAVGGNTVNAAPLLVILLTLRVAVPVLLTTRGKLTELPTKTSPKFNGEGAISMIATSAGGVTIAQRGKVHCRVQNRPSFILIMPSPFASLGSSGPEAGVLRAANI